MTWFCTHHCSDWSKVSVTVWPTKYITLMSELWDYFVRILEKLDSIITAPHSNMHKILFLYIAFYINCNPGIYTVCPITFSHDIVIPILFVISVSGHLWIQSMVCCALFCCGYNISCWCFINVLQGYLIGSGQYQTQCQNQTQCQWSMARKHHY